MFCIHCGANNQHEGKFCFQCGKALVEANAPAVENDELTKPQAEPEEDKQSQPNPAVMLDEKAGSTSGSQNFFLTVWQGEWGLAKTYWIIGVALGALLGFAIEPSMKAGIPLWVLMGVFVFYHIWAFVGIWRSAGKYKGPITWRYLSRGVTLIGTMILIARLAVFMKTENVYREGASSPQHIESSSSISPQDYKRLETFTVNLAGGKHYLQIELALKLAEPGVGEEITLKMPEIRDGVLRLLSAQKMDDLNTSEKKDRLSDEIRRQVNMVLDAREPDQGVVGVLFTSFVIQ